MFVSTLGEEDKEEVNQINQKMIEENQGLVLKFQELDIGHATMIEKYTKQIQNIENKHESKVILENFYFIRSSALFNFLCKYMLPTKTLIKGTLKVS